MEPLPAAQGRRSDPQWLEDLGVLDVLDADVARPFRARAQLGYDSNSLEVKQRSFEQTLGESGTFVVTETYDEIQFDGDLPDELFTLSPK